MIKTVFFSVCYRRKDQRVVLKGTIPWYGLKKGEECEKVAQRYLGMIKE